MCDGEEENTAGGGPEVFQDGGPQGRIDGRENTGGQFEPRTPEGNSQEGGAGALGQKEGYVNFIETEDRGLAWLRCRCSNGNKAGEGRRTFTYMADYVTKDQLKPELKFALDGAVQTIISEMGVRFGEVNQRLDRMDATLVNHGKQLASGARAIA